MKHKQEPTKEKLPPTKLQTLLNERNNLHAEKKKADFLHKKKLQALDAQIAAENQNGIKKRMKQFKMR